MGNIKSITVHIYLILGVLALNACVVLDQQDIPRIKTAIEQSYYLPHKPLQVWISVLEEYNQMRDNLTLSYSRNDYLLSWSSKLNNSGCNRNPGNSNNSAISLTTIKLSAVETGSQIFIRRICYDSKSSITPNYISNGKFEQQYMQNIKKRLGLDS